MSTSPPPEGEFTCRHCHRDAATTKRGLVRHENRCPSNPDRRVAAGEAPITLKDRLRSTARTRLDELEALIGAGIENVGDETESAVGFASEHEIELYKQKLLGKLAEYRTLEGILNA